MRHTGVKRMMVSWASPSEGVGIDFQYEVM
jgi:hypothetical protein